MAVYQIVEAPIDSEEGYRPHGRCVDLWKCKSEVIISGPAETGKTRACLEKLDAFAWKYPSSHILIVRKTRQSMNASVLKTYQEQVLGPATPVIAYGGESPQWFDYPNGSRVVVGGMDKSSKVLSAEYDLIYVNQAEELTLDEWETLTTRATGRAGHAPYAQVMGDCNPGADTHWILERAPRIAFIESRHEDNPILYDPDTGALTEQGQRTMAVLDALSGVRKERLRYGRWVSVEGAVYEDFDAVTHVIDSFPVPPHWRRVCAIDFGYTNPFVCQWWALDNEGRMYLYREIYMSQRIVEDHAQDVRRLSFKEPIEVTVADHDAEDRATLERHGVSTRPALRDVSPGIQAVAARLQKAADGRPRLFLMRDALVEQDARLVADKRPTSTQQEFPTYCWPKGGDGKPVKEVPVKVDDHGMDAMRYAVMYVDGGSRKGTFKVTRYA